MPRLIVQLPLSGGWGTDAEIAVRDELAALTNLVFAERNCDRDTLPAEYIPSELRARGLLDAAVIAYESRSRGGEPGYEVVWPEGYAGAFDLG